MSEAFVRKMFLELRKGSLAGGYLVNLLDYIDWINQLSFLRHHSIECLQKYKLAGSAQAPAKSGWVALFSAYLTTHHHPPGKVYFSASAN